MSDAEKLVDYTKAYIIGQGVWYTLHMIARRSSRDDLERLIDHIRKTFPCEECRQHFTKMTDGALDRVLDKDIFKKIYDMHDMVNKRIRKTSPSYSDVVEFFDGGEAKGVLVNYTNPQIVGPGIWWTLHSMAEHNPTLLEKFWVLLQRYFPCHICREHVVEFSKRENLHSFGRTDYPQYMWNFHDDVNILLERKSPPIDIVVEFFKKNETCKIGCTSKNDLSHGNYI